MISHGGSINPNIFTDYRFRDKKLKISPTRGNLVILNVTYK